MKLFSEYIFFPFWHVLVQTIIMLYCVYNFAGLATGVLNLAIVIPQVHRNDFFATLYFYRYCKIVLVLYLLMRN